MIFEISCSIYFIFFNFFFYFFIFFFFFINSHFFKTVIFGYFDFWLKKPPKLQKLLKKRPKSSICFIIFHISLKKNPLFNVNLFSRTFDMEQPQYDMLSCTIQEPYIWQDELHVWYAGGMFICCPFMLYIPNTFNIPLSLN